MNQRFLVYLASVVAFSFLSHGGEAPGLAIWSWSQSNFESPEACKALLDFCNAESFKHIDQHVKITKEGDEYAVANEESLRRLLQGAARRGITVNALRGERTMFFESNHEKTFAQFESLLRFNASLDEGIRFAGIKYDVEPHLTDDWRAGGASRKKVIADYLSALKRIRESQHPNLELSVDVPFWWDKQDFSCEFQGHRKLFIQHIMDLTDWIGIMSYRPSPKDVIRLSSEEIQYAAEVSRNRAVSPGISMSAKKANEAWTTFRDVPEPGFRRAVLELQTQLSTHSEVRYIIIHDYKSLVEYLNLKN